MELYPALLSDVDSDVDENAKDTVRTKASYGSGYIGYLKARSGLDSVGGSALGSCGLWCIG